MRILIVEDEALVAMEIEAMLQMGGHIATGQADDLPTALEAISLEIPDLAMVDIQLAQGCSGLDVAKAFRERGVPVLFASGNCPSERGRGLAIGCLHKPITNASLDAALAAASALLHGVEPPPIPSSMHLYEPEH